MTSSTTLSDDNNTLTPEKFKKMMNEVKNLLENIPDDGLQKFAKSKGFDLDNGDLMVIPKGFAEKHGIRPRYGVKITEIIDCSIIFMRGVNKPLNLKDKMD